MLKKVILPLSTLFFLFIFSVSVAETKTSTIPTKKQRTYLLLGQSNMAGQGLVSELNEQQKVLDSHVQFYLNGELTSLLTLNKFGPEVTFAKSIVKKYPNSSIRLIKFAPGGSLMKDWVSRDAGKHYDTLIKQVKKSNKGVLPKIDGVLWMHGERDAKSKQLASAYEKNMKTFIKMLKHDFKNDKLVFVLARISIPTSFRPAVPEVKLAQEHIAQSSEFIHIIPTDDLNKISDQVHFSTQGQLVLGERFAAMMY